MVPLSQAEAELKTSQACINCCEREQFGNVGKLKPGLEQLGAGWDILELKTPELWQLPEPDLPLTEVTLSSLTWVWISQPQFWHRRCSGAREEPSLTPATSAAPGHSLTPWVPKALDIFLRKKKIIKKGVWLCTAVTVKSQHTSLLLPSMPAKPALTPLQRGSGSWQG